MDYVLFAAADFHVSPFMTRKPFLHSIGDMTQVTRKLLDVSAGFGWSKSDNCRERKAEEEKDYI